MQYVFGAGQMWGIAAANAPTPVQFGAMQGVTVNFQFAQKDLYGRRLFPILSTRGIGKITGVAKFAAINARLFSDIVFGADAPSFGTTERAVVEELQTVVGGNLTVSHGATFTRDLGVIAQSNRDIYERTLSLPAGRQYVCNETTGLYSFDSEQENKPLLVSYCYADAANGRQVQLTNPNAGASPSFAVLLTQTFQGQALTITLNACVASKLSLPFRMEDFLIPELDFEAMADANGVLGSISFDESDDQFWIVSSVYPQAWTDYFAPAAGIARGRENVPPTEQFNVSATFAHGTLSSILRAYNNYPAEQFNVSASFVGGTVANTLRIYSNYPAEQFNVVASFVGGNLAIGLERYTNGLPEQFNVSATFTGGTLV